jgi:hypothetical protein
MSDSEKMEAYFNNIKDLSDKGLHSWSQCYYGIFSGIINENNYKVVAEVGIGYGMHARQVLKNTNVDRLYLVDPHCVYPNDAFSDDVINNGGFDNLVKEIKKELLPFENRYTWFRKPSVEVTNDEISDNCLDAIFIDGDHSFASVYADLKKWWPKVKSGGQLLGDDYNWQSVELAVKIFAKQNNLSFDILFKQEANHPIFRFKKV